GITHLSRKIRRVQRRAETVLEHPVGVLLRVRVGGREREVPKRPGAFHRQRQTCGEPPREAASLDAQPLTRGDFPPLDTMPRVTGPQLVARSEEHTSELQSRFDLV